MRKNMIYLMACAAVMILAASCAGSGKDGTAQKTVPEFVLTLSLIHISEADKYFQGRTETDRHVQGGAEADNRFKTRR